MPIKLPNLDTKTYKDISDEMIASIPKYTNLWTNHNPSDPGITILELIAWVEETTLYRINRIPDESYVNFLRLLAGASGIDEVNRLLQNPNLYRSDRKILEFLKEIEEGSKKSVPEIKAAALQFLISRYRAVTEADFRELTIEATDSDVFDAKVKRAVVSADGDKVEIIIVPDRWDDYENLGEAEKQDNYNKLIGYVKEYLSPRKLIGTIVEVKQPVFADVEIDIKVICHRHAIPEKVERSIKDRIKQHLDPFYGGSEKKGWPYRRPLVIYEIAQIVEETDGVKRAESILFDGDKELKMKLIAGLIKVVSLNVGVVKERK